jgi:hypothetical protein
MSLELSLMFEAQNSMTFKYRAPWIPMLNGNRSNTLWWTNIAMENGYL